MYNLAMLNSTIRSVAQKVTATAMLGLPFLALTAIVAPLNRTQGMPTFFRQTRYGKDGQAFEILKFQTMRDGDDADSARVTKIGKFLRKTSLDEIPQLVNVWRGEMDLVGARPLMHRRQDTWAAIQGSEDEGQSLQSDDTIQAALDRIETMRPGIFGEVQISPLRGQYETGNREAFRAIAAMEDDYFTRRQKGHLSAIWHDTVILAKTPVALAVRPGHVARDQQKSDIGSP